MTAPDETTTPPRSGSPQDLARRMDKMEANHEALARDVVQLSATIQRVEQNQNHASQLNDLRFTSLDTGLHSVSTKLDSFMARIEAILSGEIILPQTRQGEEIVAEYRAFKVNTESHFDQLDKFMTQVSTIGRVTMFVLSTNFVVTVLLILGLAYAFVSSHPVTVQP